MRRFVFLVAVLFALVGLTQWARREAPETAPADARQRLVSLAPNLTGILIDLGLSDQLVGVTSYCDYPQAAEVTKIGDFINPNLEKILSLKPDLLLAEEWASSKTVPRLRRLGIQVAEMPSPQTIDEIYGLIESVGSIVGRDDQARETVERMRARVEKVEEKAALFGSRPRLYIEIDRPTWTVGKISFTNEAIYRCGAENIFSDLSRPAPQVSEEAIISRDPDVILSFMASAKEIASRPGWDRISAVREGRIIDDFSQSQLSQGNLRLVAGMEELQRRLVDLMDLPSSADGRSAGATGEAMRRESGERP